LEEARRAVVGDVDVEVGEVEEEGLVAVVADEAQGLIDVALGEGFLLGLFLDDLLPAEEGKGRMLADLAVAAELAAHVVAVRQTEVVVEAVPGGQEGGLVAAVPLADAAGGVAGILEQAGHGLLFRVEAHPLAREEDA